LVRHFTIAGLEGALRITVGDGPATDRLVAVIASLNG
jgi:histidinol-phosphate/aromatic aminotransferase/cobyric acid decarboxylase-like protein